MQCVYADKNNIDVYKPKLVVIVGEGIDKNSKPLIMKYFVTFCFHHMEQWKQEHVLLQEKEI